MTQKGFTLIELLVVVAIIGVLAAVGVVAFNGFINSARISVIKSNHEIVEKKIHLLVQECNVNSSAKMMNIRNDTQLNEVDCYGNPVWFFGEYLKNHFNNEIGWTNPLNLTSMGVSNMGTMQEGSCYGATQDQYQGFVWVRSLTASTPGDKRVSVCTCFEKPCSSINNRLENYIRF